MESNLEDLELEEEKEEVNAEEEKTKKVDMSEEAIRKRVARGYIGTGLVTYLFITLVLWMANGNLGLSLTWPFILGGGVLIVVTPIALVGLIIKGFMD